jgi:ribosome-associated heat shock protein Hsp15
MRPPPAPGPRSGCSCQVGRPGRAIGETSTISRNAGRHEQDRARAAAGRSDRREAYSSRAILERVTEPIAADETRIDRWLCAVRLVKTRPLATRLCEAGHVQVNGLSAKPSTKVRAGDRVEAFIADRKRIVEVVRPIESRVGAAVAVTCYADHSPPVVPQAGPGIALVRGEGRPSKRRRREFDRLRRGPDA